MRHFSRQNTRGLFPIGLTFFLCLTAGLAFSQDADAKPEKKRARIVMEFLRTTGEESAVKATVKTKVDNVYENVSGVDVHFYLTDGEAPRKLGTVTTDQKGEAVLELEKTLMTPDDSVTVHSFLAAIEDDENFRDADNDLEVMESKFTMDLREEGDSLRFIRVSFSAPDSAGNYVPVEYTSVRFFVKRLFGQLPVGDEYQMTDEEGNLEVEFPGDIPGDKAGMVTIIGLIESDEYGTLQAVKTADWGMPVMTDEIMIKNKLWSARANAPAYLLVLVNAVILGIWGTIVYIIVQLVKIQKLGKSPT
jgi:hypothetical protein